MKVGSCSGRSVDARIFEECREESAKIRCPGLPEGACKVRAGADLSS